MNQKSSLVALLISAVTGIAGLFSPQVQAYVEAHPQIAVGVGAALSILSALLPSAIKK